MRLSSSCASRALTVPTATVGAWVVMLAFAGLWAWAWSNKRRDTFKQASMLPLEEDDGVVPGFNDEKE